MAISNANNVKLECPKCFKDSELEVFADIRCQHCEEDISEYRYRRPLLSATKALLLGIGGFYAVDHYLLEDARYPVEIEYAIVDSCVSASERSLSRSSYEKKQDICVCAMKQTSIDIPYKDYEGKPIQFLWKFEQNVASCS